MGKPKPFLTSENPKSETMLIRLTPEEKRQIKNRAFDCNLSMSEYLLRCALSRQTRTRHDAHTINALREVSNLLRDLYAEGRIARPEETQPVLDAVVAAIGRVWNSKREF